MLSQSPQQVSLLLFLFYTDLYISSFDSYGSEHVPKTTYLAWGEHLLQEFQI